MVFFKKKKQKKTYLGLETCHVSSPPPAAALLCEFSWAFAGLRWLSLAIVGLRWPTLAVVSFCGLHWPALTRWYTLGRLNRI
jgi:hypothetical protein